MYCAGFQTCFPCMQQRVLLTNTTYMYMYVIISGQYGEGALHLWKTEWHVLQVERSQTLSDKSATMLVDFVDPGRFCV